jgi:hypothetical protein
MVEHGISIKEEKRRVTLAAHLHIIRVYNHNHQMQKAEHIFLRFPLSFERTYTDDLGLKHTKKDTLYQIVAPGALSMVL